MRSATRSLAVLLVLSAGACGRQDPPRLDPRGDPRDPHDAPALASAAAGEASAPSAVWDAGPAPPWVDTVRSERWELAARQLDALPEAQRARPETRYVRARVALALHDAAGALSRMAGLEKELPLLDSDIARRRADAQMVVGPYIEAGEYHASRNTPASWLKASEAFEKGLDATRSRAACDRVLASDKHTRTQEAEARARRLRLGGKPPAELAADARWLAVAGVDRPAAKGAEAQLAQLDASHPLTAEEHMTRARVLADAGRTREAVLEIERAGSAPGKRPSARDRARARGDFYFRDRAHAMDAAHAFEECVRLDGARSPYLADDSFHAARALSRADHDDEAIERFLAVARRFPGTSQADQATFLAARLHLLHGRWAKAAEGFDTYARKFPQGLDRREGSRGRALAHLARKDYKVARKLFEQLADDEPDALNGARAQTMAALAALHDGDRTHAMARWTDVAKTKPLSWPALVARARLGEMGAPLPVPIEPGLAGGLAAPPLRMTLPPPVDTLHALGLDGDAEALLRERENVVVAAAPGGRGVEALCAAYGMLDRAKRRFQIAQQIPAALLSAAPTPSTRWAWECAYPMPYRPQLEEAAQRAQLAPGLLYGVMRQESGYDPEAVSPARAVGLMQLMPDTATTVAAGLKTGHEEAWLTQPGHNLLLGSTYLRELVTKFDGNVPLAVAGYNGGPDAVERWASRCKGMDLDAYAELIPYAETRVYVARVMGNYARYAFLAGLPLPTLVLRPLTPASPRSD